LSATPGYYRYPTIRGETIVFACEDDLWTVPVTGGVARRLTSGLGQASHPALSPDGKWLAFSGRDEGPTEVFVMPADGGPTRRLTYLGAYSQVLGWTPDGRVLFTSDAAVPFPHLSRLHAVGRDGGASEVLPAGPALTASFGPRGFLAIGRRRREASHWKRYRGGTAGDLWIDRDGYGQFAKLIDLEGNLTHPLWAGERVYFLSDHEGTGNVYSCAETGAGLVRHTDHEEHYARHLATDGRRLVYDCGADLHVHDLVERTTRKIEVEHRSPRTQLQRKFVDAGLHLEDYTIHPKGHLLGVVARGKAFSLGAHDGPALQHGEPEGARIRLLRWLHDGSRFVAVIDAGDEERLAVFDREAGARLDLLDDLGLGRPIELKTSPKHDRVVLTNHRSELVLVDLGLRTARVLDKSQVGEIQGFDWSPDGRYVAYGFRQSEHVCVLKLARVEDGETFAVTRGVGADGFPSFDPEGKLLCFISQRFFDPVYDGAHFDLGFPRATRPCVVTLAKETPSPFVLTPRPSDDKPAGSGAGETFVRVDRDGIEDRVLAFPVPDGIYVQVEAIEGKVLFSSVPVEGALGQGWASSVPAARGTLEAFDWKTLKAETQASGVAGFKVSHDKKTLAYRTADRLRLLKAGEKPEDAASGRKSGWVDLARIRVPVDPAREWRQMYREAWRLQRDHFWTEDMGQVDWREVYARYLPLLERAATRAEYADVIWEMQGELGTSHAYEIGGDYRAAPRYDLGFLGADLAWDEKAQRWRVAHVVRGDSWDDARRSPLATPGSEVHEGELLHAVSGREPSRTLTPEQLLLHQAGAEVVLTVGDVEGRARRQVVVKTLRSERAARYREWVETNRSVVHARTGGKVGYVHVPDMGAEGYSEFHRYFLVECERDGLIVDVRFNGGGHVSPLLLEKLARRRIAFTKSRWFGVMPYPSDSAAGPLVALTNEWAGSDGDIFSHCFKLLKLGPLIGTRTWGGVIGIWPRHFATDGGFTTQPEFSFWFKDVGWTVENRGTAPDIEVEMRPQDYVLGRDPQLDRAILEAEILLKESPPLQPDLSKRPDRRGPKLPPRV
jgi:tricorn protease